MLKTLIICIHRFSHNGGAIAGITIGLLIAVGFAGLWIFLALRRRKKQQTMELEGSAEHINISPEGGWRPPLEDGDNDAVTVNRHMSARYNNLLAQLDAAGHAGVGGGSSGELSGEGSDEQGVDVASAQSHQSAIPSSQGHPYMPGFGQAADTLREDRDNAGPMMTMSDGAAYVSRPRRESSDGPDPALWFGGRELGYLTQDPSIQPSTQGHSSSSHGNYGAPSTSKHGSYGYDDDPYAAYPVGLPTGSSSPANGSSSSDVGAGSSSGHRRSIDAKKQSGAVSKEPTPPTSYSFRKRAGSEANSLKSILGRLRGGRGASPSPELRSGPDVVVQDFTTPPPSATVARSTSPSLYTTVGTTRPPTPPSSLLRPKSPGIPNMPNTRPSLSAAYDGDRLWPNIGQPTLPPLPSPAASEYSADDAPEGLLDPKLPWRLEQARFDSSASLRDHEDYTRPIGGIVRAL